jgi:hypothetical protein
MLLIATGTAGCYSTTRVTAETLRTIAIRSPSVAFAESRYNAALELRDSDVIGRIGFHPRGRFYIDVYFYDESVGSTQVRNNPMLHILRGDMLLISNDAGSETLRIADIDYLNIRAYDSVRTAAMATLACLVLVSVVSGVFGFIYGFAAP